MKLSLKSNLTHPRKTGDYLTDEQKGLQQNYKPRMLSFFFGETFICLPMSSLMMLMGHISHDY